MRILSLQTNFDALSESMRVLALLLFTTLTFPLGGQDAANVNSKIVRVEFENQKVRILRARYAPHERLDMRSHPAKAEVQITEGVVRILTPDGKWRDDPGKAGEFFWLEPTRHAVENVGSETLELVEIEMKNVTEKSIPVEAPSHSQTTPSSQPLPVEQEPHHRWEFQNQYVRVLDVLLAPGESTLFHTHSHDSIAVRLTEATVQEQVFGKEWRPPSKVMPGYVRYVESTESPYTHRIRNVGTTPFHVIDIELLK
jgi:quercetin dioxygenase-like cupin family protein